MNERQKLAKPTWQDDLNAYLEQMKGRIDRVHVTPDQARKLMGVKKDEPMPDRPWKYRGYEVLIHDEEAS